MCYVAGRGRGMKVITATLAVLISTPAAAQERQTCASADACIQTFLKATSQAQREIKQAIRDWKETLDKKASGELFSKGTAALQGALESQVSVELDRLKECLAKIKYREAPSLLVLGRAVGFAISPQKDVGLETLGPQRPISKACSYMALNACGPCRYERHQLGAGKNRH
jgi:hypothetical protein